MSSTSEISEAEASSTKREKKMSSSSSSSSKQTKKTRSGHRSSLSGESKSKKGDDEGGERPALTRDERSSSGGGLHLLSTSDDSSKKKTTHSLTKKQKSTVHYSVDSLPTSSPSELSSSPPNLGSPVSATSPLSSPAVSPRTNQTRSNSFAFTTTHNTSFPELRLDGLQQAVAEQKTRGSSISSRVGPSLSNTSISQLPITLNLQQAQQKSKKNKKTNLPSSVRKTIAQSLSPNSNSGYSIDNRSAVCEAPQEIRSYFENTLCNILRTLGLPESSIYTICDVVDGELARQINGGATSPLPPSTPSTAAPMMVGIPERLLRNLSIQHLDYSSKRLLQKIISDTQAFLELQGQTMKIVKIQAIVRGYQTRKKYRFATKEQRSIIYEKAEIFRDLLRTERVYKRNLDSIVENYLKPLRTINPSSQLFDLQDIVAIFSNIETIADIHKGVLEGLETINEQWPFVFNIGDVFTEKLLPHLDSYGKYAVNFQSAISTIQMIASKKPKAWAVLQELKEIAPKDDGLGLHALLALPLSRITKYDNALELLLSIDSYGKVDADLDKTNLELQKVYITMRQFSEFIGKCLSQGKETVRLVDLQRRLVFPIVHPSHQSLPSNFNLLSEGRYFVKEGSMTNLKTKKKITLLLFNDLLIIAKSLGDKYHVKEVADIESVVMEDVPDQGPIKYILQISKKGGDKTRKIQFATAHEKAAWSHDISSFIDRVKKKDKVFGAPLGTLLARENSKSGIPIAVERMVTWLTERALDMEGILRVSGNQKNMELLRTQFDQDPSTVDLTGAAEHDIANLLKMYFNELPEPLLSYDLYDRFVSVIKNKDMDLGTQIETLRSIIHGGVPTSNIPLIRFMINFFHTITLHPLNKLTTKNIAILVAPHFLRAREQTLENSQDIPHIHSLVTLLIDHRSDFFPDENAQPNLISGKAGRSLYRKTIAGTTTSSFDGPRSTSTNNLASPRPQ